MCICKCIQPNGCLWMINPCRIKSVTNMCFWQIKLAILLQDSMKDFEIKQGASHLVVNHLVHSHFHPACSCSLQLVSRIVTCSNQRMLQSLSPFIHQKGILFLFYCFLQWHKHRLPVFPFKTWPCNLLTQGQHCNNSELSDCSSRRAMFSLSVYQPAGMWKRTSSWIVSQIFMQQQQQSTHSVSYMMLYCRRDCITYILGDSAYQCQYSSTIWKRIDEWICIMTSLEWFPKVPNHVKMYHLLITTR